MQQAISDTILVLRHAVLPFFEEYDRASTDEEMVQCGIIIVIYDEKPRWGGTAQQCMEVGVDAAESKRYDTSIPFMYIVAALNVAADTAGGDRSKFKEPLVKKTAENILNEYLHQMKQPGQVAFITTCLAALDIANSQMQPARQLLDQVQGDPDSKAFRMFNLFAPTAIDDVYLATMSDKEGIANYRRAISRHVYRNAEKFIEGILSKEKPTGRTLEILQRLKNGAGLMRKFQSNESISLIDEPARGFWENEVPYKVDSTGITTRADDGFLLRSRFPLEDRHYEMHLAFEFDDPAGVKLQAQKVSVAWGLSAIYVGWSVSINGAPQSVLIQAPKSKSEDIDKVIDMPIAAKNEIDVKYSGEVPVVTLNGSPLPMDFGEKSALGQMRPPNWLDISSTASIHITGFTLHHLGSAPAKAQEGEAKPGDT
jgi:hypothetical protein